MPARGPVFQVTTATRLPAASLERLTVEGAPMPRTTSHSVWPSATVPPMGAVVDALASAGPGGGAMRGRAPSALTRSSAVTGLSGVSGGDSIEMLLMNRRLGVLNHWASLDNRSVPEQPASSGATAANATMSELGSF